MNIIFTMKYCIRSSYRQTFDYEDYEYHFKFNHLRHPVQDNNNNGVDKRDKLRQIKFYQNISFYSLETVDF